ncbi:Crp/Fnr family transcriptional regulator [Methylorubrum extorquens]|uniref:Crp/Fnr family transcriptional regulator n=1 Tax=Methylorubrum extorquens TaxID=408 RepID=UPI00117279A0|nr:Crp/Fnr family transcriptional regulator [Methylorubrum extorquens]GEL41072.1 Crp/Fnr family transcriptional regulator [Methylorubrum extorquens]
MALALNPHATAMLIRKLESIAALTDEQRQAIEILPVRTHNLAARQDIVRDGDKPSHCCLILDGWACRYKLLGDGSRQILSFHIPGDVPDLQSLHVHTMDHGLATLTKAKVAFIPHENLLDLTLRHPSVGALFWRETLIDAAVFRQWMVGMGRRSAFEQVAHIFCELYLKLQAMGLAEDYQCPLPITQLDLADALGLTSVHINRVVKDMRGRNLIRLHAHTLVIEAWEELLRIAEFDPTYLHLEYGAAG